MLNEQTLHNIKSGLIDSGRETRYSLDAYAFVLSSMEFFLSTLRKRRHVSGKELSYAVGHFARKQFGLLAGTVLNHWGIHETKDFGIIVYSLIDIGILHKQERDRLSDFFSVFDFSDFFSPQQHYCIDPEYIRSVRET